MKVMTILGARPQFIKAAAISRAIRNHNRHTDRASIHEVIIHTGQHFDANMSDIFFEQLDIPRPDHHLGVAGLNHGAMTGRMLEGIETLMHQEKPDWVLVYGDTNSTLAGALAAAKLHLPVAHVEAGLRSRNLAMPEEINRILTDRISAILFCPTQTAVDNLKLEGYPFPAPSQRHQRIENVGDVMFDVTLHYREMARNKVSLDHWGLTDGTYALATLHRAENTDDPCRIESILAALREISSQCQVVLPLHPRTRNLLIAQGKQHWLEGLRVLDPVPYLDMLRLEIGARVILTDSGGVQKEAYFHRVPCITLRDETEWIETVTMGWNQVVGADRARIVSAFRQAREPQVQTPMPYGYGNASQKILNAIYIH